MGRRRSDVNIRAKRLGNETSVRPVGRNSWPTCKVLSQMAGGMAADDKGI